ncbi:MAG: hypothetical protein R6W94_10275, partial [Spirochaetia bacterium]
MNVVIQLTHHFSHFTRMAVFISAVAVALLPILTNEFLITEDGPLHVQASSALERVLDGSEVFEQFFSVNAELEPNLLGYYMLTGLLRITAPRVAERIL